MRLANKSNSEKKNSVPQIKISARSVEKTKGGFLSIKQGRTGDTNNLQTNPYYRFMNRTSWKTKNKKGITPWGRI